MRFEENSKTVHLEKDAKESFGICIVKGEVKDSPNSKLSGIFIKDIIPHTPAHRSGKFKIGDRILSINENDVRDATEQIFVSYIKSAGLSITFKIQTFDNHHDDLSEKKSSENGYESKQGVSKKVSDIKSVTESDTISIKEPVPQAQSDESDNDDDTRDMTGRTFSAAGYEIDRASAGNAKLSKRDTDAETEDDYGYTQKKIKRRYGNLGNIIKTEVHRPPNTDLGLALAGHKDRRKMACVIAGINPSGILSSANLKCGDEILEINGNVLFERCHLSAANVFKRIPTEQIVFIILRRPPDKGILAVQPLTQFPVVIDETEHLFQKYKNVKLVQVQKFGAAIGIMIIEGKHREVGAGIFISDLQAESSAEQAGLKVGDMILAINKDCIVDTDQDTAAGLLKRAEGVVNLVICSLKGDDKIEQKDKEKDKGKENEKDKGEGKDKEKQKEKETEKKKDGPPPEPEKPQDPSVIAIRNNAKTVIQIKPDKKPLGCMVVGGKDNYVTTGVMVTNVYADGAIAADNRLKIFDQIIEFNGMLLDAAKMSTLKIYQLFNLPYDTVSMMVWRNDPPEIEKLAIDVARKPGKDLGLALVANPKGVMVSEIVSAGCADIDSRLQRGDIITKLNGEDLENSSLEECYAMFRQATAKLSFEVLRAKPTTRT